MRLSTRWFGRCGPSRRPRSNRRLLTTLSRSSARGQIPGGPRVFHETPPDAPGYRRDLCQKGPHRRGRRSATPRRNHFPRRYSSSLPRAAAPAADPGQGTLRAEPGGIPQPAMATPTMVVASGPSGEVGRTRLGRWRRGAWSHAPQTSRRQRLRWSPSGPFPQQKVLDRMRAW